jgi:hypothetical protein
MSIGQQVAAWPDPYPVTCTALTFWTCSHFTGAPHTLVSGTTIGQVHSNLVLLSSIRAAHGGASSICW